MMLFAILLSCFLLTTAAPLEPRVSESAKNYAKLQILLDKLHEYRPSETEKVRVDFGILPFFVMGWSPDSKTMKTQMWYRYKYKNPHITWDPKKLMVGKIQVNKRNVWKPEIKMINAVEEQKLDFKANRFTVHHDGMVEWKENVFQRVPCVEQSSSIVCSYECAPVGEKGDNIEVHFIRMKRAFSKTAVGNQWKVEYSAPKKTKKLVDGAERPVLEFQVSYQRKK